MHGGNFQMDMHPSNLPLRKEHLLHEVHPVTRLAFSIPLPTLRRSYSIPMFFLLLIAACGLASADVSKPKPSACTLTDAEAAGLNGDAGTDVHAVSNYSKTVNDLLKAGKFKKLDCLADSVRSRKETFPGGMWKIHALYSGLAKPPLHATEEDWNRHLKLLRLWLSMRPRSITARIALAESYVNYGADARGTGLADTVSESGWKLFKERTAKAKQILEQASSLSTKCPEWYFAMQSVAFSQEWEPTARQALLEKAVKFEPAYYYYYRMYANSLLPKWGGEEGEVAKFLRKASDQIGGDAGDILYFRVAGNLVCGCPTDLQLKLSWPRIQKGFAAVEKQNGASLENWNLLSRMAVSFGDPAVAGDAFARIGDQWSEDIWQHSSVFESAKNWAKQMEPSVARNRSAEESAEANLHTPEGQRFNAAFADQIHAWMQPCAEDLAGADLGYFELLIKVGKEGTIDEITGGGNSPFMSCLGHKITGFRTSKQTVFPPPPRPDYWVRYDFNSENSTSAALK
jgi:hypothetical protein